LRDAQARKAQRNPQLAEQGVLFLRDLERPIEAVFGSRDRPIFGITELARVLWLQGFADQAIDQAQASLEEARLGS
jgi:hypothetical protein